jgi:translation elongation factor EF-Ts
MTINTELIEKLFEDSKTKLKEEYQSFIAKIKEDLSKSRQQTLYKIKRI